MKRSVYFIFIMLFFSCNNSSRELLTKNTKEEIITIADMHFDDKNYDCAFYYYELPLRIDSNYATSYAKMGRVKSI